MGLYNKIVIVGIISFSLKHYKNRRAVDYRASVFGYGEKENFAFLEIMGLH